MAKYKVPVNGHDHQVGSWPPSADLCPRSDHANQSSGGQDSQTHSRAGEASTRLSKVERVALAHDCGLVVNPDAIKDQIEGSIIQTLSKMLYEEVKLDRSRVSSVDPVSYPILQFPDVPIVHVALIDRPDQALMRAGEAFLPPGSGALGNGMFDPTGVRLRTVPFTRERVKAALEISNRLTVTQAA